MELKAHIVLVLYTSYPLILALERAALFWGYSALEGILEFLFGSRQGKGFRSVFGGGYVA